jgi:hypothetical protein
MTSLLDSGRSSAQADGMTSNLDRGDRSRGDQARAAAYLRDFLPGIVGYLVVLVVVLRFGNLDGTSGWRYLWAVLPVVPMLWVLRAVSRHLRRVDDYQQRLLLRGLGVGFAVAMFSAVTVGFLGIAGMDMRLSGWIIYGAGMLGWLVAAAFAAKR